ncbi:PREDICTED: putative disease resistance protein At4g11170 [Camelina sativa]|uniref:Disease resistance protein At4g11170 n=1 Tax=Camelina sativa TaxID=90675 RepID=A0ABM1Q983_CAMSA|nr:PREDICTED: putative disease resistance protein At4g11170 [Camelina sativa]
MIEDIVGRVSRHFFSMETLKFSDTVGMNCHMEELNFVMDTEGLIGIWGMGGIGKTTIAKCLYKEHSHRFAYHCFIENIKSSAEKGLIHLQEKLLSNILGKGHEKLWSVEQGCLYIKSRLGNRKVLLILDDVDNLDQLHVLAKETSWFGPGSRIIITTRDKGLLFSSGVRCVYCVDILGKNDAIQVFKQAAFEGGEAPSDDYEQLSIRASSLAQGLPSALKAFGTYLRRMTSIEDWEKALERLKKVPHQRVMEILRTSYMGLDGRHQAVFLHVACLFNGDSVRRVTSLLDDGELEIKALTEKSLIDISADGCIKMHVLIEQAGKEFVREESDSMPWRQKVLWEQEQIISVLQNNTVRKGS